MFNPGTGHRWLFWSAFGQEICSAQRHELGVPALDVKLRLDGFKNDFVAIPADAHFRAGHTEGFGQTNGLTAPGHKYFCYC